MGKKAVKVYQYPKCSTCRKALKYLDQNEIEYESIDITEQPPSTLELKSMIKAKGLRAAFNTSGQVYRKMKLSDKVADMSDAEAIDLLGQNGKLIKRPFVVGRKVNLLGFKEEEWEETLGIH